LQTITLSGFITLSDLQNVYKAIHNINVLVISADNNKTSIREVLQLGIKGYITKDCSKEEVLLAVQSTAKGEKFLIIKY
jgi:two-component system invasion response regulator UvrY